MYSRALSRALFIDPPRDTLPVADECDLGVLDGDAFAHVLYYLFDGVLELGGRKPVYRALDGDLVDGTVFARDFHVVVTGVLAPDRPVSYLLPIEHYREKAYLGKFAGRLEWLARRLVAYRRVCKALAYGGLLDRAWSEVHRCIHAIMTAGVGYFKVRRGPGCKPTLQVPRAPLRFVSVHLIVISLS